MKKFFRILALSIAVFSLFNITAFANAGPSLWYGADSANIIMRENCPLVVKEEKLIFDIKGQLKDYYHPEDKEKFSQYTDSFTAQYTFYNSTDTEITAQLAFPLGMRPDYVDTDIDFERYGVLINGQEIEKMVRYTKSDTYNSFDYKTEVPKLIDGYMEDSFFKPDMPVTKYILIPHAEKEIDYKREVRIVWDGENSDRTRIIPYGFSGFKWEEGKKSEISGSLSRKENLIIYALGQPFDEFPEYVFYESGTEDADKIDGYLEVLTEETTLIELLMELCTQYNGQWNVSRQDTFNIFVSSIKRDRDYYNNIGVIQTDSMYSYSSHLVCWYLYNITVAPGETVTNTVNGPLFPDVNLEYQPRKYEYTYLLSPAQQWAEFGEIEININTPYYILEINQENFMKTETGYSYKNTGLPEGELKFTVCESENPQREVNRGYAAFIGIHILIFIVFIMGFVVFMEYIHKKYD